MHTSIIFPPFLLFSFRLICRRKVNIRWVIQLLVACGPHQIITSFENSKSEVKRWRNTPICAFGLSVYLPENAESSILESSEMPNFNNQASPLTPSSHRREERQRTSFKIAHSYAHLGYTRLTRTLFSFNQVNRQIILITLIGGNFSRRKVEFFRFDLLVIHIQHYFPFFNFPPLPLIIADFALRYCKILRVVVPLQAFKCLQVKYLQETSP